MFLLISRLFALKLQTLDGIEHIRPSQVLCRLPQMLFIKSIFHVAETGRIDLIGSRVVFRRKFDTRYLAGNISQLGIEILIKQPRGPHTQCIIAAQPRQIIDKHHTQTIACRRQSRRTTSNTATDNNQIHLRNNLRRSIAQQTTAFGCKNVIIDRRCLFRFSEINCIGPSVEACQIVQTYLVLPGGEGHPTGILPAPTGARRTQLIGENPIIDFELKGTRPLPVIPRSCPIVGAHIDVIVTSLRKLHGGGGVFHSASHAVSHEIGRLDLIESLMIQYPTSALSKRLSLDQHLRSHRSLQGE